jgi:hypothetical protein
MKGATMGKVEIWSIGSSEECDPIGYGQYIVHYTNNTCLVFDTQTQTHKYPQQYIRVDAVDEMDAAIKGMARLKCLYGANNVRFGSEDELCHDTVKGGEDEFGDGSTD